jgi:hypothetical protein
MKKYFVFMFCLLCAVLFVTSCAKSGKDEKSDSVGLLKIPAVSNQSASDDDSSKQPAQTSTFVEPKFTLHGNEILTIEKLTLVDSNQLTITLKNGRNEETTVTATVADKINAAKGVPFAKLATVNKKGTLFIYAYASSDNYTWIAFGFLGEHLPETEKAEIVYCFSNPNNPSSAHNSSLIAKNGVKTLKSFKIKVAANGTVEATDFIYLLV